MNNITGFGGRPVAGGWPFLPCPGQFPPPQPGYGADCYTPGPYGPGTWAPPPPYFGGYPPPNFGPPKMFFDEWGLSYPAQQWATVQVTPISPMMPGNSGTYQPGPWNPPTSPPTAPVPPVADPPGLPGSVARIRRDVREGLRALDRVTSVLTDVAGGDLADKAKAAAREFSEARRDTDDRDSSSNGSKAESHLKDVERGLKHLEDGPGDLRLLPMALSAIRGELSNLMANKQGRPEVIRGLNKRLDSIEASLKPASSALSELNQSSYELQRNLREAKGYAEDVAGDREDRDVSSDARRGEQASDRLKDGLDELSGAVKPAAGQLRAIYASLQSVSSEADRL